MVELIISILETLRSGIIDPKQLIVQLFFNFGAKVLLVLYAWLLKPIIELLVTVSEWKKTLYCLFSLILMNFIWLHATQLSSISNASGFASWTFLGKRLDSPSM